ncbi:ester cyclase family protein [Micromonospora soli]|uniref:ester cyclase family protein n=1 Tax=Micromonospora sp. NBRC 110009 TaxID=3061627 RepID=UPI0026734BBF|nr:ester cyclase family protein [Micromonospora sp. NBRC 110009]WKU00437.1 ester cyclase family protein [Micromonospora sp. NBRC 110009]
MTPQPHIEPARRDPAPVLSERTLRRLVAEIHNGHRFDRLDAYYDPAGRDHDPRVVPGRDGRRTFWRELVTGFPDLSVTIETAVADNDRVMAFLTWRGRQRGEFAGRPADRRALELHTSELFRLGADGRVVEHAAVVDYSILRTFGLQPLQEPGPARPELSGPHTPVERANATRVLAAYREVLSEHRLDRADDYYEHDYLHHNAQVPAVPNGVEAFRLYFAGNFAAFPDLTATVDHILASGDRVMVFATWRGHFTGLSRGRRPTGKRLLMYTSDVFRMVSGRVAEHWEVVDYSGLENVGMTVRPPAGG